MFIAWLNLDLGIETCFFDGMDAYSMTWLQFVLPIYIWLLVGLIATLCNFSTTAAKILSSTNPIQAYCCTSNTLPPLIHKAPCTIIAAFSFTTSEYMYPDDEIKVVWLYDGNILDTLTRMMAGTLIPLHVFGQPCGISVPLPTCPTLSFYQCILCWTSTSSSGYHGLTIYLKMKSFLVQDAHHAP